MIRTILWAAVCALLLSLQACDTSSGAAALCRIIYQATNADSGAAPAAGIFPAGSMAKVAGNPGAMGRTGAAAGKSWVFVGWNTRPDGTGVDYPVGKRFPIAADLVLYARWKEITSTLLAGKRNFWTLDLVDDSWYTVEAVKLVEESKCIVYADLHAFLTIEENWGQAVADEYEKDTNGIYAKIADGITGVFKNTSNPSKTIEDVDGNGKVIFLLLDIQDGYTGEGGYVAGYFHSYHMYAAGYPYSNSNEADMLFMDVNPATNEGAGGKTFYSTMAHELQHLINWSVTNNGPRSTVMETWIDEGLSMAAEFVYGGEQKDRVDYFNADPYETIVNGNNFFYWNINGNTWDNDVLADYATAYLFFRWLGIHGGGNGIYTSVLNAASSNFQAVTGAAASIATGIDSGASTAGEKWDALLSGWMRANMTASAAGYFGYKGLVSGKTTGPKAPYFYGTNHATIPLYPGEGVFSQGTDTYSDSGNIKYIPNVPIGTSGGNKALLTWNGNPVISGDKETGFLANTTGGRSAGGPAVSGGGEEIVLPVSYPVGFRDLPGERVPAGKRSAGTGKNK